MEGAADLQGKRVVIVEDEGITLMQLRRMLRRAGMEIVGEVFNGDEAVQVVLATRPDLVLMDINIPGVSGLQAIRRILAEYSVCILVMTAYSDTAHQQEAEASGACGYLIKPFTGESLLPQIHAAFQKYKEKDNLQKEE